MNTRSGIKLSIARRSAFAALSVLGLLGLAGATVHAGDPGTVVVLPTSGIVDQVMAGYVTDGIANAAQDGAPAVVIGLDTPGGSLDAMRTIFHAELNAPIPVIVWVGPRRASRQRRHVHHARLAPALDGARHEHRCRVAGRQHGGDITGTEGQKVMNDAIATITSIATQRHRRSNGP